MATALPAHEARSMSVRARSVGWMKPALVLLLIAMLVAAFIVGRATESGDEILGLADARTVALVDDTIDVWNTKDTSALATYYTDDAVFVDHISGVDRTGIDEISTMVDLRGDWGIVRTSDVVRQGDLATYTFTYTGMRKGVAVLHLEGEMISHQWVIGS